MRFREIKIYVISRDINSWDLMELIVVRNFYEIKRIRIFFKIAVDYAVILSLAAHFPLPRFPGGRLGFPAHRSRAFRVSCTFVRENRGNVSTLRVTSSSPGVRTTGSRPWLSSNSRPSPVRAPRGCCCSSYYPPPPPPPPPAAAAAPDLTLRSVSDEHMSAAAFVRLRNARNAAVDRTCVRPSARGLAPPRAFPFVTRNALSLPLTVAARARVSPAGR